MIGQRIDSRPRTESRPLENWQLPAPDTRGIVAAAARDRSPFVSAGRGTAAPVIYPPEEDLLAIREVSYVYPSFGRTPKRRSIALPTTP